MHPDGYMLSICSMMGKDMKGFIRVFKINADEPLKRIQIGQFHTEALSY
jgi:hypothetical protein